MPDIPRLRQALAVEAKHGYADLRGSQFRFSEFASQQLSSLLETYPGRRDLEEFEESFSRYGKLDLLERESLINRLMTTLPKLVIPKEEKPRKRSELKTVEKAKKTEKPSDWRDEGILSVKGVGPGLAGVLEKLGVTTIEQLLRHYPRQHLDYANRTPICDLQPGVPATVWGTIRKTEAFSPPSKPNLSIVTVHVHDGTGTLSARWFYGKSNRYQLERYKARFPVGESILLSGEAHDDEFLHRLVMDRPDWESLGKAEDSLHVGRIVPVYPLTEGLSVKVLRRAIHRAVEDYAERLPEVIPSSIRQKLELLPQSEAVRYIHFPTDQESLEKARRTLVFTEFFLFQLSLCVRRSLRDRQGKAPSIHSTGTLIGKLLENLPFSLTGAQERVLSEILADMGREIPMNRLVQGDVGSGKTVVAMLALLAAVEAGFQGALMAPTEILAEQHYAKFREWLHPLGLQPALLLGKQTAKERKAHLRAIETGHCPLVVGTHALIQDGVNFQNLGLVVIDEQHRFGVKQRAALRSKGESPQLLSMTATPIPRTLSLVTHGDLDVSIIDELPPGRKPIETRWVTARGRKEAHALIEREIERGYQAYIVFPLVEESEKLELKAATQEKEVIEQIFPRYQVGLLHGQMLPDEKEAAIDAFRRGDLQILVSTTVIEVGVDVPKATVMMIEHAERFGLSQLHQLRGRVGRGGDQSYCILVSSNRSESTKRRMEVMVSTTDGFLIAEEDLRLRGPGEFLGTRQSGLPEFALADLVEDAPLLEEARTEAQALSKQDPLLEQHGILLDEIKRQHDPRAVENLEAG